MDLCWVGMEFLFTYKKGGWLKSSLFFFVFGFYAEQVLSDYDVHVWNYSAYSGEDCEQKPGRGL